MIMDTATQLPATASRPARAHQTAAAAAAAAHSEMYQTTSKAAHIPPALQRSPFKKPVSALEAEPQALEQYRKRWTQHGGVSGSRAISVARSSFVPPLGSTARRDEIMQRLRTALAAHGYEKFHQLARFFRTVDRNKDRKIDRYEMMEASARFGLQLVPGDIETLLQFYDANQDGKLSYDELLLALRGPLSARRRDVVERAFRKFDKTGDGKVTIDDLRGVYDARFHPAVRAGRMTEQEALREFLASFDGNADGTVTLAEFEAYYAGVSANVDDDEHFEQLVKSAWGLADSD